MAVTLCPVPTALVRPAITLNEAQQILARGHQTEAEWRSVSMDEQIFRSFKARQIIANVLCSADLTAYIWSPSERWYRVPHDFWRIPGMTIQEITERGVFAEEYSDCERFLDAPEDIDGQSFVVWADDISKLADNLGQHVEEVGRLGRDKLLGPDVRPPLTIRWHQRRYEKSRFYLAMPELFDAAGRHMFRDEWTGEEVDYRDLGQELPHPKFVFKEKPLEHASFPVDLSGSTEANRPEPSRLTVAQCEAHIMDYGLYDAHKSRVCSWLGFDPSEENKLTSYLWSLARDHWIAWNRRRKHILRKRMEVFWQIHQMALSGALKFRFVSEHGDMRELTQGDWECSFAVATDRFNCDGLPCDPRYMMRRPDREGDLAAYYEQFHGELQVDTRIVERVFGTTACDDGSTVAGGRAQGEPSFRQGTLPSFATKSNRDHEAAAHNVARLLQGKSCKSVEEGLSRSLELVERNNREDQSIKRAIRNAYNLMYDLRGDPL